MIQQVQHVLGYVPWMRTPLLAQRIDLDVRLYYTAVQNLVYGCGNVPQTIAESNDTPPLHCAQYVDMFFQLPAGLQCDPIQLTELRKQVQDAWYNLLQDDSRYLYDSLHSRIHACVDARAGFTVMLLFGHPFLVTYVFHLV